MRAKELSKLLHHARRHESVRLVSSKEFGRTTLLAELESALNAQGFTVIRIAGEPTLATTRYGALRQALSSGDRLAPQITPSEARDIIAIELSRSPSPVILIDDAEWLDLHSAEAIAPLFERDGVSGVFVTPPFQNLSAEQRVIAHMLRAEARVELSALSFEQVGVLSQRFLQGNVSPEIASEIFSMSSGITGVAADILRTTQAAGQLIQHPDRWISTERSLWNEGLEEIIERLLAPLDDTSIRLLHALSLVGDLAADEFQNFDPVSADRLSRSGLVTVFRDPHGRSRVSPRPALVADYFRQRPIDLQHIAARELLSRYAAVHKEQVDSGVELTALRADFYSMHSDTEETHNAGLARFLREQTEHRLVVSGREWRRNQDPARALAYLDTLLQSGTYVATAVEVLERTSPDAASDSELLQLALHEQILRQQDIALPLRHSEALRKLHPSFAPALDAYDMYLLFGREGLRPEVKRWLKRSDTDPVGFTRTIAAYIRTTSGEVLSEAEIAEPAGSLPIQRVISEQSRLVTLARRAVAMDAVEEFLTDPLSLGPGDDPVPFLVNSYVRAQLLLGIGRVTAARQILSQALSIGDLDLRYGALYAAMLRWSAFLHFRDGRADIATALLSESRGYSALRGPLPAMRPEFGDALEVLLTGDRQAAGRIFYGEALECYEHSFFDAAWSSARFAFQLAPSEETLEVLERISAKDPFVWTRPLIKFARAALRQDPKLMVHLGELVTQSELTTAADFLEDVEYAQQEAGIVPSADYARAVSEAHQSFQIYREPLSHVVVREPVRWVETLTPREREIAPLTATLSNREIAERLTLSVRTVENHIARSMKKLGISSRGELSAAVSNAPKSGSATGTGDVA
ncbi:helix-turn-helix transcriptional regulator [Leucobacter aridicollis]|uniref:helix-turn-helix transcriptional regulator n=1 Tax=Leucobacter aridicollis TaxID=283878 RepID=UPI002101DC18|nr:LuxR C-terminal-related transcriptional regulator [Leucobacter aridicollis]UTX53095.1 hypothetical protein KI794_15610 [Leucobacter aridicollis]